MFPKHFKDVSRVFQGKLNHVLKELEGCFKGVSFVFQKVKRCAPKKNQGFTNRIQAFIFMNNFPFGQKSVFFQFTGWLTKKRFRCLLGSNAGKM